MAQNFTQIREAVDARALTNASVSSATFILENQPFDATSVRDWNGVVYVRSTLIPAATENITVGTEGMIKVSGAYNMDVIGHMDLGSTLVSSTADSLLATFPRGLYLTLANGDRLTIDSSSLTNGVNQPAYAVNRLYVQSIWVQFFLFTQP